MKDAIKTIDKQYDNTLLSQFDYKTDNKRYLLGDETWIPSHFPMRIYNHVVLSFDTRSLIFKFLNKVLQNARDCTAGLDYSLPFCVRVEEYHKRLITETNIYFKEVFNISDNIILRWNESFIFDLCTFQKYENLDYLLGYIRLSSK